MLPMKFRANTTKNTPNHIWNDVLKGLVAVELPGADDKFVVRFDSLGKIILMLRTESTAVE